MFISSPSGLQGINQQRRQNQPYRMSGGGVKSNGGYAAEVLRLVHTLRCLCEGLQKETKNSPLSTCIIVLSLHPLTHWVVDLGNWAE